MFTTLGMPITSYNKWNGLYLHDRSCCCLLPKIKMFASQEAELRETPMPQQLERNALEE